jgi:hypothetical protein
MHALADYPQELGEIESFTDIDKGPDFVVQYKTRSSAEQVGF